MTPAPLRDEFAAIEGHAVTRQSRKEKLTRLFDSPKVRVDLIELVLCEGTPNVPGSYAGSRCPPP
jgi:hypothetical protein